LGLDIKIAAFTTGSGKAPCWQSCLMIKLSCLFANLRQGSHKFCLPICALSN